MRLLLQREHSKQDWMFGLLSVWKGGYYEAFCNTLEDELREVKIKEETAIPEGEYEVVFEDSPKFGKDTLTLLNVPNFKYIRIHGGNSDDDTEGCILVGNYVDKTQGIIGGAKNGNVLSNLKKLVQEAFERNEKVFIEIRNAKGDNYVDTGNPATA